MICSSSINCAAHQAPAETIVLQYARTPFISYVWFHKPCVIRSRSAGLVPPQQNTEKKQGM